MVHETDAAASLNRKAREQMKLRLLNDIRVDLVVCELEGWSQMEYIQEIWTILNEFVSRGETKGKGVNNGENETC